jgi:hypothetical protein
VERAGSYAAPLALAVFLAMLRSQDRLLRQEHVDVGGGGELKVAWCNVNLDSLTPAFLPSVVQATDSFKIERPLGLVLATERCFPFCETCLRQGVLISNEL